MVVIYGCELTEPPSSIHCFRDVTLYSKVFLRNENILVCPKGTKSIYWGWIKKYGAHDFIEEIITPQEKQSGIYIGYKGYLNIEYINENNYGNLINALKKIKI